MKMWLRGLQLVQYSEAFEQTIGDDLKTVSAQESRHIATAHHYHTHSRANSLGIDALTRIWTRTVPAAAASR